MSIVINLLSGPGCGKSTTAAGIFHQMKLENRSIELVQEYVKTWAWEGKAPSSFIDQLYITAKQMRKETLLYKKTDYIVTDSPVLLGNVYTELVGSSALDDVLEEYINYCNKKHIRHLYFMLERVKKYDPHGRFQTEEQAKELDFMIQRKLNDMVESRYIDKSNIFYISGDPETQPTQIINIIKGIKYDV